MANWRGSLTQTVLYTPGASNNVNCTYNENEARTIGDWNYDCKVNLADFADMATTWQVVDGAELADLAVMALNWLADTSIY